MPRATRPPRLEARRLGSRNRALGGAGRSNVRRFRQSSPELGLSQEHLAPPTVDGIGPLRRPVACACFSGSAAPTSPSKTRSKLAAEAAMVVPDQVALTAVSLDDLVICTRPLAATPCDVTPARVRWPEGRR